MFCIYLRTNSDLCHLQHKLIGFCNPDEKCLQRSTDWVFKYGGLRFVFKGLKNLLHICISVNYIFVSFFVARHHHIQEVSYFIRISIQQLAVIVCTNVLVKCGLLTDAPFSTTWPVHLW